MITILSVALGLAAALTVGVAGCNLLVYCVAHRRCHDRAACLPTVGTPLVLGTSPLRAGGRPNRYFVRRIRAAAELYSEGRVGRFILSGGTDVWGNDEAEAMRRALIEKGVETDAMITDNGGHRTLLSVVRARDVFGAERLVFISQRFHNERAVFLARAMGIEAYGYNAEAVHGGKAPIILAREAVARVRAVLDVVGLALRGEQRRKR
ncbi:MAG: YdcF family protein [Bacteroidaceae bacterium]|nr:YdcF family protein [Bacteroidaceae bacterium]